MLPVRFHPAPPSSGPAGPTPPFARPAASPLPPPFPPVPPSTAPSVPRRTITAPEGLPGAPRPRGKGEGSRLNLLLTFATWRDNSWADALPTLLEPLGVIAHRARTARQAEHTLRTTSIHIAVVDLGLPLDDQAPDEPSPPAGSRILELLRRLEEPPPTVVIKNASSPRDNHRSLAAALRFDAFAVVDRHAATTELMLKVFQRALARYYQDRWPT